MSSTDRCSAALGLCGLAATRLPVPTPSVLPSMRQPPPSGILPSFWTCTSAPAGRRTGSPAARSTCLRQLIRQVTKTGAPSRGRARPGRRWRPDRGVVPAEVDHLRTTGQVRRDEGCGREDRSCVSTAPVSTCRRAHRIAGGRDAPRPARSDSRGQQPHRASPQPASRSQGPFGVARGPPGSRGGSR